MNFVTLVSSSVFSNKLKPPVFGFFKKIWVTFCVVVLGSPTSGYYLGEKQQSSNWWFSVVIPICDKPQTLLVFVTDPTSRNQFTSDVFVFVNSLLQPCLRPSFQFSRSAPLGLWWMRRLKWWWRICLQDFQWPFTPSTSLRIRTTGRPSDTTSLTTEEWCPVGFSPFVSCSSPTESYLHFGVCQWL